MCVTYEIIADRAEIKIIGTCSREDLISGFKNLLSDQKLSKATSILINVGESETLPPSDVVEQIGHVIGASKERFSGRVSVFVTQQVRYGLARQLSVYLESYNLISMPFYDYQAAVAWLSETN